MENVCSLGKIPAHSSAGTSASNEQCWRAVQYRPSLRPLFPHALRNEVQVETVTSIDPDDSYDTVAMNAASASTMISGLPFEGSRFQALIDDQWVAFRADLSVNVQYLNLLSQAACLTAERLLSL